MKKEDIRRFVSSQKLAVVATVNGAKPQAAVVEFAEKPDLTIIIDTLKTSRKYKNLQLNPSASVVIGWDNDITIQIDGQAYELAGRALKDAQEIYFAKNPRAKKWADKPEIAYFAIKPNWIRYSDVSKHPWHIKEFDIEVGNTQAS